MLHWIIPATDTCSELVECYWFIEKTTDTDSSFPKLNPDPCAHLIITPNSYSYSSDEGAISGQGSHFLCAHQSTFELDHCKAFTHLGVKFRTGAPYILSENNEHFTALDQVIELSVNDLLSMSDEDQRQMYALARSDKTQCVAMLERYLQPWLTRSKSDQHSKLVSKVCDELQHVSISELASQLFCSQRTIERSFRRVTGLTLKQYQAMTKLELMLEHLYQKSPADIDWVDIAFEFGFSDQPHLIRYLKNQIGTTPKKYAVNRGFTIDIYGAVSSHE
ncbi:helix-turn-helix domain-containing protein [Vibrio ezurae]|uniref:Putative transcriptional regulator n=1 Tax=Vibrio ezurae NBRC 102218 TaxID=1219080 RepID=U3B049_9VIBR|nr:helix-turn-helix domain-containing protein [Vibrio ezurae]GAD79345.1 putative transcriptional regulator [Vibrio ezurae NBRC 102218]